MEESIEVLFPDDYLQYGVTQKKQIFVALESCSEVGLQDSSK
jgi:hypothetical protein